MNINHEWQKIRVKKLPPLKFSEIMRKETPFILDVRPLSFEEKNESFIEKSVLIPLVFLENRYKEIPKNRQLLITDMAMKQSPVAAKFLITKGYSVLGILKGGIERWEIEKMPVSKREPLQSNRRTFH